VPESPLSPLEETDSTQILLYLHNSHISYLINAVISYLQKQGTFFWLHEIWICNSKFLGENVFKKFNIVCLDLPDPDHQLPLRDQPKYARFKGAKNYSISSTDSIFLPETSTILAVFDILYKGEVGLALL
jgi:hypothetical protein